MKKATRNNIVVPFRTVLRFAVDLGKLEVMPRLPRQHRVSLHVVEPPSMEEVHAVLEVACPATRVVLALACYAGLWAGEIRGIRFLDLALDEGYLIVRQAICRGVVDTPKSGHERKVWLVPPLIEVLREASRRPHARADLVTVSPKGEPWGEFGLRKAFQRVLAKVELPRSRLHNLRHFFVTECFKSGASAPDVQALAGHKHLHVTQRYAHTDDESKKAAIAALGARLGTK